ncbi:serrate RNA effector molecule homolog [Diadema antillarum]|uniref:serrate RNA effector molecule homolog n=1 Tax=Diadema antillarum TaxID=105358 RepID=UPI003A860D61
MESDEEYERRPRRRDKFRGERRDYNDRRERDERRRDDWQDRRAQVGRMSPTQMRNRNRTFRNEWTRRDFPDYDRGRQDRYSPPSRRNDISPPAKRQRRDWDNSGYGYDGGHGNQGYGGYRSNWGGGGGGGGGGGSGGGMMRSGQRGQYQGQGHGHGMDSEQGGRGESGSGSGQMLSFKQFLASQEDSIDDQEAVKKYNEYKLEFHKAQLSEFFLAHKDEEWFRTKYYPDECERQQAETEDAIDRRLCVFMEFFKKGDVDKVGLQSDRSEGVIRLLDSVVIRLEGGTDLDLSILDQPEPTRIGERERSVSESARPPKVEEKLQDSKKEEGEEDGEEVEKEEKKADVEDGEAESKETEEDKKTTEGEEGPTPPPPKDDDSKVSLPEPIPPPPAQDDEKKDEEEAEKEGDTGHQSKKRKRGKKRKRPRDQEYSDSESDISSSSGSSESEESDQEQEMQEPEPAPPGLESNTDKGASESDNKLEEGEAKEEGEEGEEGEGEKEEQEEGEKEPEQPKPRALHKTFSIFIRNVAPIIKKEEIVALCKRYKGFMRVALAEPQPDRNFQRHGWVTFDRTVNIKEICWNLSSIRLRDCELSPVVNRDLAHRIRAVSGISAHKVIVQADLKLAARLVQLMDSKHELFTGEPGWDARKQKAKEDKQKEKEEEKKKKEESEAAAAAATAGGDAEKGEKTEEGSIEEKEEPKPVKEEPREPLPARNPILENITDYLVEELSAEEEVLLGKKADGEEEGQEVGDVTFEKDEHLCKVLDRLLLYLRVVHSIDYYNCSVYGIEDEMPNRCGIMHCRGQNPPTRITQKDMENWQTNFENKLQPLMNIKAKMSDEELTKLGKKDQDLEVDKFIKANTKEMAKDKWLCPLSGKKFKGPEFVKKHIFNKHNDKIEAVKKEVLFFNNYLQDSARHRILESAKPKPAPSSSREGQGDQGHNGQRGGYHGYQQQSSYDGQRERQQQPLYTQNRGYSQQGRGGYDQGYGYSSQGPPQRQYQRRGDPRSIIQYRDLDAPDDSDFF